MSTLQFGDQVFNFGWRYAISSIIFMIFVNHLTCSECKFHSNGRIFHFWEQIFLKWGDWYFFMSNVCYLAVILIFLVVTWWLPVFIARYCWITARYRSLLLVPTFGMNVIFPLKFLRVVFCRTTMNNCFCCLINHSCRVSS